MNIFQRLGSHCRTTWRLSNTKHANVILARKATFAQFGDQQSQLDDIMSALEELKQNRDELCEKYENTCEESENIKKRLTNQTNEAKLFGIQQFCADMLSVTDTLNMVCGWVPKTEINDSQPHVKKLYEALEKTETTLNNVLNRHGVTLVNPLYEKFDPNFHEALFEQVVDDKSPGTIVKVSKPGYKLHDRVLRPAKVVVSKKSR